MLKFLNSIVYIKNSIIFVKEIITKTKHNENFKTTMGSKTRLIS